ncbi:MAG: signal peptidase [Pseudonocardiales bacterium]|uniref:signal peptidase I n=1 Tax=Pseudonocardia sp. TaxID=60912 RepID=UPI002637B460|nr:signal peptidase I [Pseudonocardia sp.]MCW2719888.1 signal peptidase [Pseudonocardia sp.]MDT7614245.1 signal peptidase [Pseudonocardiales bacterium]MDT7711160.1 signal peptidase [Pseudonocardiales bacterium]
MALRRTRLNGRAAARTWLARGLLAAVVALVAGVVTGVVPFEPVRVPTDSMAPTLQAGDQVVLDHRSRPLRAGDLVVVPDPDDGTLLVKRAVALGGQSVGLASGVLVVDGVPVAEPYADLTHQEGVWFGPVTVPPGAVFLLGDSRATSIDSRRFGPVPVTSVVGHVTVRLWPRPGPLPTAR